MSSLRANIDEVTEMAYVDVVEEVNNRGLTKLPLIGRNKEIVELIRKISNTGIKNVIITGEAGCGKSSFAEALAMVISDEEVKENLPSSLQEKNGVPKTIFKISGADFTAGSAYVGTLEEKAKKILEKAIEKNAILFIDEIHAMHKDLFDVFKPFLDGKKDICVIGTSTTKEYSKFINKDIALKRRFQELKLGEVTKEDARMIVEDLAERKEVALENGLANYLVNFASKYIKGLASPAREITILDNTISGKKLQNSEINIDKLSVKYKRAEKSKNMKLDWDSIELRDMLSDSLLEYEEATQELNENIGEEFSNKLIKHVIEKSTGLDNYMKLLDRNMAKTDLVKELEMTEQVLKFCVSAYKSEDSEKYIEEFEIQGIDIQQSMLSTNSLERMIICYALKKEKMQNKILQIQESKQVENTISKKDVIETISKMTNLPEVFFTRDAEEIRNYKNNVIKKITDRVKGQNHVLEPIMNKVVNYMMGLKEDNKPILTGMFAGPTGVGKTEMAKAIAESVFGNEKSMIRIDMSEYADQSAITKLLGANPGYVGHGTSQTLIDRIRENPNVVLLFDEMEKAHPDVRMALLQLLDEGRLTDAKGDTADFTNAIVLLTTNLRLEQNVSKMGFLNPNHSEEKKDYSKALVEYLPRELVNRLDIVEVFNNMNEEMALNVLQKYIDQEQKKFEEIGFDVTISNAAKAEIIAKSDINLFGGRELHRNFMHCIQDMMDKYIEGEIQGEKVFIDCDLEEGEFLYNQQVEIIEIPA